MLAAAALVVVSTSAQAQTSISQTFDLQNGVAGHEVGFLTFEVSSAGMFELFTKAPLHDGVLYLFEGTPGSFGTRLGYNDDSCDPALCGPSGSARNAYFTAALGVGTYTAAGSDYSFYESQARSGVNDYIRANGDFTIVVRSDDGIATAASTTTPEPATVALLGTGLLGVGGVVRRRRKALQG